MAFKISVNQITTNKIIGQTANYNIPRNHNYTKTEITFFHLILLLIKDFSKLKLNKL